MKLLIAFFVLVSIIPAWAINSKTSKGIEYPDFAILINNKEHSRIQVNCNEIKDKSGDITCTFDQIIVQYFYNKNSETDILNFKNKNDKEIQSELNSIKDTCADFNKDFAQTYSSVPFDDAKKKFLLDFKKLCTDPSRENYIALMEGLLQTDKSTCKLFNRTYVQEFKYNIVSKKWIFQDGPSNFLNNCGIINLAYLEKDSKREWDNSWNYTLRDIVTNKSGHWLSSKCSELTEGKDNVENEVTYYPAFSNQTKETQLMNCKYINFGDI